MLELLNPRLWIALAVVAVLAFAGLFLYRAGAASVRVKWDAEKLAQAETVRAAERENRATESRRQLNVIEAQNAQAKRARTLQTDADLARAERDGLLNDLAAVRGQLPSPAARASGNDTDANRKLLDVLDAGIEQLTRAGERLAKAADGHANDTMTLQQAWPK